MEASRGRLMSCYRIRSAHDLGSRLQNTPDRLLMRQGSSSTVDFSLPDGELGTRAASEGVGIGAESLPSLADARALVDQFVQGHIV